MTHVAIIDYGLNNLRSIARAVELAGAERVTIAKLPADAKAATHVVLPGVGAFGAAMHNLDERQWSSALKTETRPLLGICLGMHVLFESSAESPGVAGLGILDGSLQHLSWLGTGRIPHIGWNDVAATGEGLISHEDPRDYYFVHSFALPTTTRSACATTPFLGGRFVSAVSQRNIHGTQFHPEKSSRPGLDLLTRFLESAGC